MKSWKVISGALLVFAGFCAGVGLNFKTVHSAPGDPNPALKAVAHDATLAGEGTTSAPLGIANGGVSAPKLSTSMSPTPSQILSFNGANLAWQNAPIGGVRLADNVGHVIGPMVGGLAGNGFVLRQIGSLTFQILVDHNGFATWTTINFLHTTSDCSGPRYFFAYSNSEANSDNGDLTRQNTNFGTQLFYPADPIQRVAMRSSEQINAPNDANKPGLCTTFNQPATLPVGLATKFDLGTLGFVPPFHLEF